MNTRIFSLPSFFFFKEKLQAKAAVSHSGLLTMVNLFDCYFYVLMFHSILFLW